MLYGHAESMTSKDVLMLSAARTHASTGTGRAIRIAAGLSMSEVADAIGVAEPTIWRWEGGKNRPRGAAAIRWAELLNDLKAAAKKNA